MLLFSETLNVFRARVETLAVKIAQKEMFLRVNCGTAYCLQSGKEMPFPKMALFDDGKRLGFFDPSYPIIGLSRSLCHEAKTAVIQDILRHELAHWVIHHGDPQSSLSHEREFRQVCRRFGWGTDVSSATLDLRAANAQTQGDIRSEALIARVQKLLELARSDNPHESELATLRANQLILKHHLGFVQKNQTQLVFMDVVLKAKRADAKVRAIARILRSFLVYPVINRPSKGVVFLEVTSPDKTSVTLAGHIAAFLDSELPRLWQRTRKEKGLGGSRAKANFMLGVAEGYLKKQAKLCQDEKNEKALCKINDNMKAKVGLVYPHLRYAQFRLGLQDSALRAGTDAGADLCIRKPIVPKSSSKVLPP